MNKKEMIEEMAKLICTYPQCIHYNIIGECVNAECQTVDFAENLYKQGYRKIPKGSVVLSKEEYELYDVVKKGYPNDMTCLAEKFTQIDHKARKETAEKFAAKIQDYLNDKVCEEFGDNACDVTYFTIDVDKVISDVFEIAEQFGVAVR